MLLPAPACGRRGTGALLVIFGEWARRYSRFRPAGLKNFPWEVGAGTM